MEKELSFAEKKLQEKMEKISAFAASLNVGLRAKMIITEDGIRPTIAWNDGEIYEEETPAVADSVPAVEETPAV